MLWIIQVSRGDLFEGGSLFWGILTFSLSLSLNILATLIIVARLMVYRFRVVGVLGSTHALHYISIAAMITESAAIISIFSVPLIVSFALESPLSALTIPALSQVQTFATLLIIFRVAQGRAWDDRAQHNLTDLVAATHLGTEGPVNQIHERMHCRQGCTSDSSVAVLDTIFDGGSGHAGGSMRTLQSCVVTADAYVVN